MGVCVRARPRFDIAARFTAALPWQTSAQFPKFNLHRLIGTCQARRKGRWVGGRGGERESQCRTGTVGRHVTAACYSHNEAERKKKETQRDGGRLWKAPSAEENSPSVIERRRDGGGWSVGQRLCLQQVHTNSSSNANR